MRSGIVAEGAELPEVELLDIERYRELITKRFPSWEADDDPLPIDCQLLLREFACRPTRALRPKFFSGLSTSAKRTRLSSLILSAS